ncbi:hypothetical protein [Streptomyces sp. G45]|uniref:hypothetical protein n=1 Tax=Streptomyces sp. G45 TaxID=3406627 RepID=UPI003C1A24D2
MRNFSNNSEPCQEEVSTPVSTAETAVSTVEPAFPTPLRVLFTIGVTRTYFDAPDDETAAVGPALHKAFDDLEGRFGIHVLGTLDDDRLRVGDDSSSPWLSYVLADAPDLDTVARVCDLVRQTRVGPHRLWRYLRIEAKVGRPLFFATR